jgi:glyoxylase-like metal-dependent hydrolase (beta-lactamase superfamily II)
MIHEILPVGLLQCNCSIFGDESTREAMVVDPGDNVEEIVAILDRHGLRVKCIVITHAHIDHIGGAADLKSRVGAPVYMNANDQGLYDHLDMQAAWLGMEAPARTGVDTPVRDGDSIRMGETEFQVLHTPGHTQGSSCLLVPTQNLLVAGDTLFLDSIGRTDLPGGDHRQILRSIRDKLWPLPEETRVIPGHGRNTTIGREKELNPFLRAL